jgi:hypothetical protein
MNTSNGNWTRRGFAAKQGAMPSACRPSATRYRPRTSVAQVAAALAASLRWARPPSWLPLCPFDSPGRVSPSRPLTGRLFLLRSHSRVWTSEGPIRCNCFSTAAQRGAGPWPFPLPAEPRTDVWPLRNLKESTSPSIQGGLRSHSRRGS